MVKTLNLTSVRVEIHGTGTNTCSLVEWTENFIAGKPRFDRPDLVWCVFDVDSFPKENFKRVLDRANQNKYRVAWSNECFEIWYLLHFDYFDAGVDRDTYGERLTDRLGSRYEKNRDDIYKLTSQTGRRPAKRRKAARDTSNDRPSLIPRSHPMEPLHHRRRVGAIPSPTQLSPGISNSNPAKLTPPVTTSER